MVRLTVDFPKGLHNELAATVEASRFKSRNEAVRYYVRNGLQKEQIND